MVKGLIAFDPPMGPKPIERIVLPDGKENTSNAAVRIFFMALTKECLYIVHICRKDSTSYVRIPGQYDVVSIHVKRPHFLFTARRGIVNMFKWQCIQGEDDECKIYHKYQLYVSIDISSSSILTLKPASESGMNISKQTEK